MVKLFKAKNKEKKAPINQNEVLVGGKHSFLFTEAFKSLRTNVQFSLPKEGCRKIMVTSSVAGEGKSTVSTHLASSFAEMGSSVLIIDCDLRRGKTHRIFETKRSPGLANVLGGFSDVTSAVQKTKIENLFLLPAGVVPPNPAELLASNRMSLLIEEFSKSFDYIILDTTPISVVSDALSLVNHVDGILVVARQNYTDETSLDRCIHNLEFVEAKILGIVFNDVVDNSNGRYGRYSKYIKYRRYGYYKGGYYIASRTEDSNS